jgi:hypothetical protein
MMRTTLTLMMMGAMIMAHRIVTLSSEKTLLIDPLMPKMKTS